MKLSYKFLIIFTILVFSYNNNWANIIISHPTNIQECEGIENQFFEIIPNVNLNLYDYYVQWYKDDKKHGAPQKNNAKLLFPKLLFEMSGVYFAEIWIVNKDSEPNLSIIDKEFSVKTLLYVNTKTKIIKQPQKINYVTIGGNVTISFEAHLINNNKNNSKNNIEIQWLKGNKIITDNNRISGSKSNILNINNITNDDFGNDYRVVVKSLCGIDTSLNFSINNLFITWSRYGFGFDPKKCAGETFGFIITPYISDGSELALKWYYDDKPLVDGAEVSGSNSDSLTIKLFDNKPIYLVAESKKHNLSNKFIAFNLILDKKLTENTNISDFGFYWYVNKGPIILEQPGPKEIILEEGEMLDLLFKTDNLYFNMFRWFKDKNELSFKPDKRLVIQDIKTSDAGKYYCEAINKCGSTFTDTINVIVNTSSIYLGIEDNKAYNEEFNFDFYPNPTNSSVNINYNSEFNANNQNSKIELISTTGSIIKTFEFSGNTSINFDLKAENLPFGIYFIQLTTKNKTITKKLVYLN